MKVLVRAWRELADKNAGGSERHVDMLLTGLAERGHEVLLVTGGQTGDRAYGTRSVGGGYTQYLRMPFHDSGVHKDWDVVVDVANGVTYCTPLWRSGPTVLMVHHVHLDQWATRFPGPAAQLGRTFEKRLLPFVYRKSDVIALSASTSTSLAALGYSPERISTVPPAVDLHVDPRPESSTPLFVVVGRLVQYKRVDLALRAWNQVRDTVGGRLVIIGDGPERTALEETAGPDVEFLGFVDEDVKRKLLTEAWLLLHPATHEGWGLVITEAAVQGTPALGFDVDGVRDAVIDGKTGVLVESERDFVDAWVRLASDDSLRGQLSRDAGSSVEGFTTEAAVDHFESVLIRAVRRQGSSSVGRGPRSTD